MKFLTTCLLVCFYLVIYAQNSNLFFTAAPSFIKSPVESIYRDLFYKNNTNALDSSDQLINTPFLKKSLSYGLSVGYRHNIKNLYLTAAIDFKNIRYSMEYTKYGVAKQVPVYNLGLSFGVGYKFRFNKYYFSPQLGLGYSRILNNNANLWYSYNQGSQVYLNQQTGLIDTLNYMYSYNYELNSSGNNFYSFNSGFSLGKEFKNKSAIEIGILYNSFLVSHQIQATRSYGNVGNPAIDNSFSINSSRRFKTELFSLLFTYTIPIAYGFSKVE